MEFIYIGCFPDPEELRRTAAGIRGEAPKLEREIEHPHVTFVYRPEEVDRSLFGKKLRIGPERTFVAGKLVTEIFKTGDVIWTYGRSKRLEGGANFWSLVMKTTGGEEYVAPVGDAGTAQAALEKIVSFGGPVVTGFDKDKQRLYDKDLTGFIGRAKKLHAAALAAEKEEPEEPEEETEE